MQVTLDAIKARANLKYLWSRRVYIVKLKWIHPEWLRALVALLIVIPAFLIFAFGFTMMVLFVPLVILVKFFGLGWAILLWIIIYGYTSVRIMRWLKRQQRNRPRRSRARMNQPL